MKSNYHTHTTFCDGKNTAREMTLAAIDKGFDILGFSSHSMYPFAESWHIAPREHQAYCNEIRSLKEEFSSQLQILLGFEADYLPGICLPDLNRYKAFKPDYLIGAVHYVMGKDGFIEADGNCEEVKEGIEKYFSGSVKEAVCTYFASEREMLKKGNFTFLAHPDLIRKQNRSEMLFNEEDDWYKKEVDALALDISRSGVCVEINTGGMARGYLKSPYPSLYFLEKLHTLNVPLTINSDAHQCQHLDFAFEEAKVLAKKAGYEELTFLDAGSLKMQNI